MTPELLEALETISNILLFVGGTVLSLHLWQLRF